MTDEQKEVLVAAAREVRLRSIATFSGFRVGSAVQTANGKIFTGCNIESASFGLTICAERVAIWKALSEGEREFTGLAVVADTTDLTPPCGACRQLIWEFCRDSAIILSNLHGRSELLNARDLMPRAFDAEFLIENLRRE